ncbi:ABC transporter substrate-binding protein [Halosolutus gelatinilyticus]|uniref:ABC transporter substrate-binding protein n=1 Tax=Halosolutus gelatinilyticus TaxID=2931975 RepID=UPI001FF136D1|nr:ABC transporter substrate-binding protein [Halosolutus gelatinilyticus]
MIGATGAGAAGMLAGCFGSSSGGDSSEFVSAILGTQEDLQFNPHNLTLTPDWSSNYAVYVTGAIDVRTHGEYLPVGVTDWTIENQQLRATMQDSLTWHNGDPVTAEDYARSFKLAVLANEPISQYIDDAREDVYAEDDTTLVIDMDDTYNPAGLLSNSLVGVLIFAHEELYGGIIDQYEDAGSEDQISNVQTELVEMNVRGEDLEPYACGPFELDEIDTQGARFTVYEDYPWSDIQQNLEENYDVDLSDYPDELDYESQFSRFFSERPSLDQAAINGEIDGTDGIEIDDQNELENAYPDDADYIPIISGWTDAFVFNWRNGEHADMWRDARVRKAFAHIIDFEGVTRQYHGSWGEIDNNFDGMSPPMTSSVSDGFHDSLTTYEQDHDRAAELLREAGLTKEGGQWYKPNGEQFVAPWKAPSNVQYQQDGMEYAASNLSEFGIESNVETVEGTTYFGETIPQLDYELARGYIGFSNVVTGWRLTWLRYDAENQSEEPFSYYLQEPYGEPGLEVPPIGEPDSSDTIEVDPVALFEELQHTTDEARVTEISETLSWAYNQTVPKLPAGAGAYPWYMNSSWSYPDQLGEDRLSGLMPFTYSLPQIGAISAPDE